MPIAAVVEFPGVEGYDGRSEYDRLTREVNAGEPMTRTAHWNDGLLSHVATIDEQGNTLIVDVWKDQASMDAWMQRIMPLTQQTPNIPEPAFVSRTSTTS